MVKIADLGVARITRETLHAHTFAGTRVYMSPEMFACEVRNDQSKYSDKTDIW